MPQVFSDLFDYSKVFLGFIDFHSHASAFLLWIFHLHFPLYLPGYFQKQIDRHTGKTTPWTMLRFIASDPGQDIVIHSSTPAFNHDPHRARQKGCQYRDLPRFNFTESPTPSHQLRIPLRVQTTAAFFLMPSPCRGFLGIGHFPWPKSQNTGLPKSHLQVLGPLLQFWLE